MSNLEHYFENILYEEGLYDDDPNMEFLTKEEVEAVRTCASYVLYSIFCSRERFLKFVKEFEVDPIDCIEAVKRFPTAEKTGKWIDMGDFEQCSVCHGTHLKEFQTYYGKAVWVKTQYCPNCGTRMVE